MYKLVPIAFFLLTVSWMTASIRVFGRHDALPVSQTTVAAAGDREVLWELQMPVLVDRFYRQRHEALFWFAPGEAAAEGRDQLLACIDSAAWQGLDSSRYHPARLRQLLSVMGPGRDSAGSGRRLMQIDREYTDAALGLIQDVFRGKGIDSSLSYDGVSAAYSGRDEDTVLACLSAISPDGFRQKLYHLEPVSVEYTVLKTALRDYLDSANGARIARLSFALNAWRWVHHFHFDRFILVNIPSATLRYYTGDTVDLGMRIVAGQPSKRTPRFAAWVDGLVLYPYWNIPHHIAVRELLPLFRKSPALLTLMDIQVLDARGRLIDPAKVDWAAYHAADFPYTLRQAPGCENALGVLKFDINSPFDVYMHDTNLKRAFTSSWRYLSHGCIRLEKPFLLGELLLDHRLDTTLLNACLRDQQPVPITLQHHVPVFVLYNMVEADMRGGLAWLKDVYHLRP
jgi:L,D-transpeptidase YcbB